MPYSISGSGYTSGGPLMYPGTSVPVYGASGPQSYGAPPAAHVAGRVSPSQQGTLMYPGTTVPIYGFGNVGYVDPNANPNTNPFHLPNPEVSGGGLPTYMGDPSPVLNNGGIYGQGYQNNVPSPIIHNPDGSVTITNGFSGPDPNAPAPVDPPTVGTPTWSPGMTGLAPSSARPVSVGSEQMSGGYATSGLGRQVPGDNPALYTGSPMTQSPGNTSQLVYQGATGLPGTGTYAGSPPSFGGGGASPGLTSGPVSGYSGAYGGVPSVPNPGATAGGAIGGNLGNLGGLYNLATGVGGASAAGAGQQLEQNLPGWGAATQESMGNIQSLLAGNIPQDVQNLMAQQAAERGISMGSPDSPNASSALLRSLGLTSLGLQQQGEQNLTTAIGRTPTGPAFNPSSMLITPQQQWEAQLLANYLGAAPIPSQAAGANLNAFQRGLGRGTGATGGGGTGYSPTAGGGGASALGFGFGTLGPNRTTGPSTGVFGNAGAGQQIDWLTGEPISSLYGPPTTSQYPAPVQSGGDYGGSYYGDVGLGPVAGGGPTDYSNPSTWDFTGADFSNPDFYSGLTNDEYYSLFGG